MSNISVPMYVHYAPYLIQPGFAGINLSWNAAPGRSTIPFGEKTIQSAWPALDGAERLPRLIRTNQNAAPLEFVQPLLPEIPYSSASFTTSSCT